MQNHKNFSTVLLWESAAPLAAKITGRAACQVVNWKREIPQETALQKPRYTFASLVSCPSFRWVRLQTRLSSNS